jgi:hypothetical protein
VHGGESTRDFVVALRIRLNNEISL